MGDTMVTTEQILAYYDRDPEKIASALLRVGAEHRDIVRERELRAIAEREAEKAIGPHKVSPPGRELVLHPIVIEPKGGAS